jgi:hypothetical protein
VRQGPQLAANERIDSEHFLQNHLVRANNWEIHPVLKLEVCSQGKVCTATSDENWKSLDDL